MKTESETEMAKTKKYSELSIYSPKITASDYARVFDQLIRRHIPLFEFLDIGKMFSFRGVNLVIKRYNNTVKIYVQDTKDLSSQTALLFPFRFNDSKPLELIPHTHLSFAFKWVSGSNLFDFLIKEDAQEIHLRIVKFFGGYYGVGKFVNSKGGAGRFFLSNPCKFLEIDLENNPLFYIELLDPVPTMRPCWNT